MELDNSAPFIKVQADWHKEGRDGRTFYEKALYEVRKGYAVIVAPDTIKLIKKLPSL